MKIRLSTLLLFIFGTILTIDGIGQSKFALDSMGCELILPEKWTNNQAKITQGEMYGYSEDSSILLKIKKIQLLESITSLEVLHQMEILMADAGYYRFEEYGMDTATRYKKLLPDDPVNAEDVSFSSYLYPVGEKFFAQLVIIYHSGTKQIVLSLSFPPDEYLKCQDEIQIILGSFRLLK